MYLKQNRKEKINEKADEVRLDNMMNEFPVEPILIAKQLKIEIIQVDFKKHEGYVVSGGIIKNNKEFKIYVNSNDTMKRKRFTIAHELGHFFLGHLNDKGEYVDLHKESHYVDDEVELEADEFAGCLLMPKVIVEDKFKTLKLLGFGTDSIISILGGIFVVSQSAMKYRLKNLNLL